MAVLGIDIGSRTIARVILEGDKISDALVVDSGPAPLDTARSLIGNPSEYEKVVATGYGRHAVRSDFAAEVITEIKAHAAGAGHIFPGCRSVLDIGGQDSKVILLNSRGRVADFLMNDRCAAGTGKFIEIMLKTLNIGFAELVARARSSAASVSINSMCAVFAESEVISLLAGGAAVDDVARAVLNSICSRISNMLHRTGASPETVFSGGVAAIPGLPAYFAEMMALPGFLVPPNPQIVGALGAAVHGRDTLS
jgi:predicted CoA-substrate-specific enzyme activase